MRSDLPRFQKPRAPRIDAFVDQLEHELRDEFKRNPPRRHLKATRLLDRFGRFVLRPVFNAVTLVVLFAVVFLTAQPPPSIVMHDLAATSRASENVSLWAEVVEIPDPAPQFVPFVARERAPRFVVFASTPPAPTPDPPVALAPF